MIRGNTGFGLEKHGVRPDDMLMLVGVDVADLEAWKTENDELSQVVQAAVLTDGTIIFAGAIVTGVIFTAAAEAHPSYAELARVAAMVVNRSSAGARRAAMAHLSGGTK